jgi:5-formyltetrahydrofolate cyclo-ligase
LDNKVRILTEKKLLRQEVASHRKNENRESVERKSIEITRKVVNSEFFINSGTIMCYMDFNNEVMTKYIISHCFENGKRVILPLVDTINGERKIVPYEIMDLETDVAPGVFGILEPKKDSAKICDPEEIDLVIVPGVAFDINKNRLGYGAGFYDRFLKSVKPDCAKVGIAFEFQIFEAVPVEEHDIPLDFVITEERIL